MALVRERTGKHPVKISALIPTTTTTFHGFIQSLQVNATSRQAITASFHVLSKLPFKKFKIQGSVHCKYIPIYIQQDATLTQFIYIWKLLYMFRAVNPPIVRSTHNRIYSIWYLSSHYCYLPLLWKSWNCVPTLP